MFTEIPITITKTARRRGDTWLGALFSIAALGLLLALGGCDNPACIFGGMGCNGGSGTTGALGVNPASVPADGEWILPTAPAIDRFFPSGAPADTHTPIVIVFTESMAPTNSNAAFELVAQGLGPIPLQIAALIGNGRVLVMFPLTPLQPSASYDIRFRQNIAFQDRKGQPIAVPADRKVGTFTTLATAGTAPRVVMTWPIDATTNQGATSEIDVVFDRAIDPASVDLSSFAVTVGGNPPLFNPIAQPLVLAGGLTTDTRVFRYRSVNADGVPVSLGAGAMVAVGLSAAGHSIHDTTMAVLAPTNFHFTIAPFSAPSTIAITSTPSDAIGIDAISGPADLAIQVGLVGAASGDLLGLYMIGTEPNVVQNPKLIALFREVAFVAPFTSFTMTAQEIDLLASSSPVHARFADGVVAFAFQVRRGAVRSPVKLLDVDRKTNGVQSPLLDTIAPQLLGLSTSGTVTSSFRSDMRDVVLVGRASEVLSFATVTTALGTNVVTLGELPPVVGAHSSGLFVAAPVRLGLLPSAPPLGYTITVYDRAQNAAPPVSGTFQQLGASGPGNALPAGNLAVEVFDATTQLAVQGAKVYTHENVGGIVTEVANPLTTTDAQGLATIAGATAGETILTIDATASGYDLFTFDGVPTDRISVPLFPTLLSGATAQGTVASTSTELNLDTRSVADSRALEIGETLFPVSTCSFSPTNTRFECPFGPVPIRARRIGAQSALIVLVPANPFLYSALTFLKGFELALPLPPAIAGATTSNTLVLPFQLDSGTLDPEERPIEVAAHGLSSANYPTLSGDPRIRVEATSPGIPGTVTVGEGVAFDAGLPPNTWLVRAAYPGAADGVQDVPQDKKGSLVTQGTIDADLLVRDELVDSAGNRGGARPRLSLLPAMLVPPAPAVVDPAPVVNLGGVSFDLKFSDVLPDAYGEQGLYRVVLTDSALRRWTIYRFDAPDASGPDVTLHVVYVGPGNTLPLASGTLQCQVSAYAWPGFVPAQFLWSDIEREHDLYSHAIPVAITPP